MTTNFELQLFEFIIGMSSGSLRVLKDALVIAAFDLVIADLFCKFGEMAIAVESSINFPLGLSLIEFFIALVIYKKRSSNKL